MCLKPLGGSPSFGCWGVSGDVLKGALDCGWDGRAGGKVISLGYESLFARRVRQVDDLSLRGGVAVGALHSKRFFLGTDVQKLAGLFTSDAVFCFVAAIRKVELLDIGTHPPPTDIVVFVRVSFLVTLFKFLYYIEINIIFI